MPKPKPSSSRSLPNFLRISRTPKGPRDMRYLPDAAVHQSTQTQMDMHHHQRQKRSDEDRRASPSSPPPPPPAPRRTDSENSGLDFGTTSEHFDQDLSGSPGQLMSEMMASRNPPTGYDIENRGRPPRASTALENARPPLQSSPRGDGRRRHSMDISSFQVALDTFGDQRVQLERTKNENQKLRSERDHYQLVYNNKSREFARMQDLRDDAVNSVKALERRLGPLAEENKALNARVHEYHRANQWLGNELSERKKLLESKETELQALKSQAKKFDDRLNKQRAIQKEALDEQRVRMHKEKDEQRVRMHKEKEEVDRLLREANKVISREKGMVNGLKSEIMGLQKTARDLEQKLKNASRALLESETTAKGHEETIKHLEKQSRKDAIASQEISSEVRKAQETAFNMMLEPARWMPKADNEVRRNFDKIRDDLWNWTKACARKDMPSEEFRSDVALHTLRNVCQSNDDTFYFSIDDSRYSTKLPALVCMATLSRLLYANIFKSPFFWQKPEISAHSGETIGEKLIGMDEIYNEAMKDDVKAANEWRCQMLRTFDPQITNTDKSTDVQSKAEKCREGAAQRLVEEFLGSNVKLFLNTEVLSDNRIKTLFEIIARAAKLSYRLWTQKNRLHVMNFEELDLKGDDGVSRFKFGAELVQHQAYHNVELSKDSTSLDGKPVCIIAHPAIVAYGDSSGEQYDSYKVWKKAEVWMG